MPHPWWKRAVLVAALVSSLSLARRADATVAVQLDRPQLLALSDLVVQASVVGVTYRWNEDHSQILTLTRIHVSQYLKGAGPSELVVRQFGGEIDGLVSRIAGDAHLAPGQTVVLCLRQGAGVVYLTAMAQSAWYVRNVPGTGPVAEQDLSGLTLTRLVDGKYELIEARSSEPAEPLAHLLSDLSARVRAATPTGVSR